MYYPHSAQGSLKLPGDAEKGCTVKREQMVDISEMHGRTFQKARNIGSKHSTTFSSSVLFLLVRLEEWCTKSIEAKQFPPDSTDNPLVLVSQWKEPGLEFRP